MNKKHIEKKVLNLNGRLIYALAIVIIAAPLVLSGCAETFSPPVGFANEVSTVGGGGGADPVVPGSGGRKVSDIKAENPDFDKYNDKPGAPGMRIAAVTQLENIGDDVTTQSTLGLWGDNKFHIEGYGSSFNGTFANAGFTDAMILYYDKLMPGEFKISARIRIKRAGGVSTGKGINIGAYSNTDAGEDENGVPKWKAGQGSKGMGLFFRAESQPQFRLYYSDQFASTTAGTSAVIPELGDLKLTKEYVYEVARVKIDPTKEEDEIISYQDGGSASAPVMKTTRNLMYTYKLMDSKTYLPVVYRDVGVNSYPVQLPPGTQHYFPFGSAYDANKILENAPGLTTGIPIDSARHPIGNTAIEMSQSLRGAVYPGISITGTVVEVSQIKIWTSDKYDGNGMTWNYVTGIGDEPIFETPDTIPAYVPANSFTMNINPSTPSTLTGGENVYTWTGAGTPGQWPALKGNGYKIEITATVIPYYADENIYYQLFPVETPDLAFIDDQENVTISGDETQKQEINGEKAYKKWTISFDKEKITKNTKASARFVLIARNLELDADKNAADYSLLQTLPEYHFRIEVTRPVDGSSWD